MAKISEVYYEESPHEQSVIKKAIVVKYFKAWASVMKSNIIRYKRGKNLAYFDLFCGPGRHETGETTAPLEIMEHILSDEFLSERCITLFNDCNESYIDQLENNIEALDNYELLKNEPTYESVEVTDSFFEELKDSNIIPSLSFIDPFGYCGVSVDLLNFLLRSFGCDVILFFNYNDINRGLTNLSVKERMKSIFTVELHEELCVKLETVDKPQEREKLILNYFTKAMRSKYREENPYSKKKIYVFPFRFQFKDRNRTSHYVFFISKDILAVKIMKDIMWGLDNNKVNNIASFEFIPNNIQESFLDMLDPKFDELKDSLLNNYADSNVRVIDIIDDYVETIYIGKNIKKALLELEEENKIRVIEGRSRKGSMPDNAIIKIIKK
ncbi:MAG: three-Cys-motif partner protein TcmP [Tissierellia bacterium]|nr:three-Cys-motif partner protein TcmP [Tissierellia bacterium]